MVLVGPNVGEMFKLHGGNTPIGRARESGIRFLDDGVSRTHATIRIDQGGASVVDNDSRNGTYVNGNRVSRHLLKDGDKIQLGPNVICKLVEGDELDESFQRHMYDSSLRDGLTLTFNKRYFTERIESEFRFAQRHHETLALLLLDLDHFKRVNDAHGHLAGDHVLRKFAEALQKSVRNEDVLARYGGEEFAIISRAIPLKHARILGERLRGITAAIDIDFGGRKIPITVSIGVATLPEVEVTEPSELIAAADRALYWAKSRGRNLVCVYSDDMDEEDTRPS